MSRTRRKVENLTERVEGEFQIGNLNNRNTGQSIWNNCFQDTGHQATEGVMAERWKTSKVSPVIAQLTALREFPGCGTERENTGETWRDPCGEGS